MSPKIIVAALCLLPLVAFSQGRKKSKKAEPAPSFTPSADGIDYRMLDSPLPALRLVTLDGKVIDNTALANDANLFVVLFRPDCDHCQELTRSIQKNIGLFKQSKIVMVAGAMMKQPAQDFVRLLKMEMYPAIPVTLDSSEYINKVFLYQSIPQINVYDHNRRLIRTMAGVITADSLKQYIE